MIKKVLSIFSILLLCTYIASCTTSGGGTTPDSNENDIKVMQINQLIQKLPTDIQIENEEQISQIIVLYDSLPISYRQQINGYDFVLESRVKIGALKVEVLINELPSIDNATLEDKTLIDDVNKAYNQLSDDAKALVSNYDKLTALNDLIEDLLAQIDARIQDVINAIDLFANKDLTLDDEASIINARNLYDALTQDQQPLVINYEKLVSAETKIVELKQIQSYIEQASVVVNLINNLPSESNLVITDKDTLESARQSYDNLSIEVQAYVTNISVLVSLEERMNVLEAAYSTAQEVIALINELPSVDSITLSDENKVEAARAKYNELSILAKTYVTNNSILTELEATLEQLQKAYDEANVVVNLINSLPSVDSIDLSYTDQVEATRTKYNELSTLAKTYVTNYDTLVSLEEKLEELDKNESENILDTISDVATSSTRETLILENDDATFTWSSSNKNLYVIDGDEAYINMAYQKHQSQKVTISVKITYKAGGSTTKSKIVTVNPIVFEDMPATPVATYFQSSATSSYKNYSTRYKTENTLFSTKAKDVLDIVYYAFAVPSANGTLSISYSSTYLKEVVAIRESSVRVVLSINGVSAETYTALDTIVSNATLLDTFVKNTMDLVDANYLDGVDLDWESSSGHIVNATKMNKLAQAFRTEMNNRQEANGTPYLLTAAIPATSWGAGTDRFNFKTLNDILDYVNMMSYDANKTNITSHVAPLYVSKSYSSYGFGAHYGTTLFTGYGLSKSKILIGAAGYGKVYSVTGTVNESSTCPGLGINGTLTKIDGVSGTHTSGTIFGHGIEILLKNSNYVKYTEYNSSNQIVGSYLYSKTDKIFVTYDSEEVLLAKYNYAKASTGMGIMCWAYTEDTADIYINVIYDDIY